MKEKEVNEKQDQINRLQLQLQNGGQGGSIDAKEDETLIMKVNEMQTLLDAIDQLKQYIEQNQRIWDESQQNLNAAGDKSNDVSMKQDDVQALIEAIDKMKRYIDMKEKIWNQQSSGDGNMTAEMAASKQLNMPVEDVQNLLEAIDKLRKYIDSKEEQWSQLKGGDG